jgi:hypothetical protein
MRFLEVLEAGDKTSLAGLLPEYPISSHTTTLVSETG